MTIKPLTENAADPKAVKDAARKERYGRRGELDDLRAVLSTPEGRRFYWRLLGHCRTLESIWDSSAKIHYNSGRQDVGHFLVAEMEAADKRAWARMKAEHDEGDLDS